MYLCYGLFLFALLQLVRCALIFDLSSSNWTVTNDNKSISTHGTVPGGVYSMLEDNCMIGDILFGKNDINYRWIGNDNWTYFKEFEVNSEALKFPLTQLILHGIDTIAEVFINGKHVLSCDNMFVRYIVDISLQAGANNISIAFQSPIIAANQRALQLGYVVPPVCHPSSYNGECNVNMLRKMQASYAWDWGPAFPSVGVWKPIHILLSEGPFIRSVGVSTISEKSYWRLNVTVWLDPTEMLLKDTIAVKISHPKSGLILAFEKKFDLKIKTEEVYLSFLVAKSKVSLWWPNGYGEQNLYDFEVSSSVSSKAIKFGFRTIELRQETPSQDEKQGKTFQFVVNGIPIFAKGSNWIPSHVLPERLSDASRIVPLLKAAASSHFNMLRVWGGGVYESDLFYETCDELGILIWQDLMFACSMYPVNNAFLDSVKIEIKQQVQRLQHHPSIAVWAGNNENEAALVQNWYDTVKNFSGYKSDYLKLYVDTIMPIVESTDMSRIFLTSSPSNGEHTKDEGYVSKNPGDTLYGDVHYYNYLNDGWDDRIYPNPRFASEYGVQSLPSITCLRAALPLGEMAWNSSFLEHRQHSPGGNAIIEQQISHNLPLSKKINDIVFLSQINQAMSMKTESEKYRRLKSMLLDSGEGYTMGALYWQLNDIWQAPSWSSIDYCGNWKMLQYFAKDFFAPTIVSPVLSPDRSEVLVYVVIDGPAGHPTANTTLNVYSWMSESWNPIKKLTSLQKMVDNESFLVLHTTLQEVLEGGKKDDYFFTATLEVDEKLIAPPNFLFLSSLSGVIPETSVKISNYTLVDDHSVELTLTAEKYAFFVWLDLKGLKGTFSHNGFHMLEPLAKVIFYSDLPVAEISLENINVTWLKRSYS